MNCLNQVVITKIGSVFSLYHQQQKSHLIQKRDCYGISFSMGGEVEYMLDGKTYLSDQNHVVILQQGKDYAINCKKSGEFALINFYCTEESAPRFASVEIQNNDNYILEFNRLKRLRLFGGEKINRAEMFSCLYGIFAKICEAGGKETFPVLKETVLFMEKELQNPMLNNKILAEKIGFSEIYFRKIFKSRYGITPKQYLIDLRIKKAKDYLKTGDKSITEISSLCGFGSVYHFCEIFKQKVGTTPGAYRTGNKYRYNYS